MPKARPERRFSPSNRVANRLAQARELLRMFASTQIEHRRHLAQIEDDIRGGSRDADGNLLGGP
ncbi:hypothetical protein LRS10_22115 [Phenylobacterium sp. J426]|uniref:hypothetical protein n=1 Tax=Phenylobacterium sp. J426 TaxID=2898439 RepID=UPI0021512EA7|nr:hypothetical protein [Phenylobacterium sp. J426]MCR5876606.1 hypothetical protein [Phenylobacterium sp. J426]